MPRKAEKASNINTQHKRLLDTSKAPMPWDTQK